MLVVVVVGVFRYVSCEHYVFNSSVLYSAGGIYGKHSLFVVRVWVCVISLLGQLL